jgi:hypothetical protein
MEKIHDMDMNKTEIKRIQAPSPECPECMINMKRSFWFDDESSNGSSNYRHVLICGRCHSVYEEILNEANVWGPRTT